MDLYENLIKERNNWLNFRRPLALRLDPDLGIVKGSSTLRKDPESCLSIKTYKVKKYFTNYRKFPERLE